MRIDVNDTLEKAMTKILIEGLDLAGKSTASRAILAEFKPRPTLRHNALTENNEIYTLADTMRRARTMNSAVLGPLYLAAIELDLQRYAPAEGNVLQDSTIILRSLAYYRARGMEKLAAGFEVYLADKRHPTFDRAVVLTAGIEVRRQRLKKRQREEPGEVADDDLMVVKAPETFLRMERELISEAVRRFGADVIDTTTMTPEEVKMTVLSIVGQ
jgi:thymidylate kinase